MEYSTDTAILWYWGDGIIRISNQTWDPLIYITHFHEGKINCSTFTKRQTTFLIQPKGILAKKDMLHVFSTYILASSPLFCYSNNAHTYTTYSYCQLYGFVVCELVFAFHSNVLDFFLTSLLSCFKFLGILIFIKFNVFTKIKRNCIQFHICKNSMPQYCALEVYMGYSFLQFITREIFEREKQHMFEIIRQYFF